MRLFVGVWLSEEIQDAVMNYIECSRKEILGWKWTTRQNLHFTVKFLGELPEGRLNELSAALKMTATQNPPFSLRLGKVGVFPKRGTPRIIWLGVERGEQELIQLANLVESNCLERGFEKSDKPFQAHVTIARAKREDYSGSNPSLPFGSSGMPVAEAPLPKLGLETAMLVCSFSLIESNLYPSGAVYQRIEDFQFEKQPFGN